MEPEIITEAQTWLVNNQGLLIEYAVNIAAALITLLVGYIAANLISSAVIKVMQARAGHHCHPLRRQYPQVRHPGVRGDRRAGPGRGADRFFVAIIGAAGLAIGLALQGSLSNLPPAFCSSSSAPSRQGNSSRWQAPMAWCNPFSSLPPPSPPVTTRWW